jgi:hypothetical protein
MPAAVAQRDRDVGGGLVDPVLGTARASELVAQSMRIAAAADVRALVAATQPA